MLNNSFFNHNNFINTIYALNIALEKHFAGNLLKNEVNRVVYSSTNFALRKRSKESTWDDSFLPFMNYKMNNIDEGTDRFIWSSSGKLRGIWISELSKYIRFAPITISYDSTVWYHQHIDNLFGLTEVIWDDTSETIIDFEIEITDEQGEPKKLDMFGVLGYSFQYNPQFDRNDWLQENKIMSNTLNFDIQTYILKEGAEAWIPEEVLFNFIHSKGATEDNPDKAFQWLQSYMQE